MNTPKHETITIEIDSTSLLEVQTMLEQIHTAARAGHLDSGGNPHFNVSLEFATINTTQDFGPLEALLDRAERRKHGGLLQIKSKPGIGTAVYFALPVTASVSYQLPVLSHEFDLEGETVRIMRDNL